MFGEKWRWFLKDGEKYHAAFLADVAALAHPALPALVVKCSLASGGRGEIVCHTAEELMQAVRTALARWPAAQVTVAPYSKDDTLPDEPR